jgi:hypothetical protein
MRTKGAAALMRGASPAWNTLALVLFAAFVVSFGLPVRAR